MKFKLEYEDVKTWTQLLYRLESLTATIKAEHGTRENAMLPMKADITTVLSHDPIGTYELDWPDRVE